LHLAGHVKQLNMPLPHQSSNANTAGIMGM
jgi:hypothetical protein